MHFIKLPDHFCGPTKSSSITLPSHSSTRFVASFFIELPLTNLALFFSCFYLHITTILFILFMKKAHISVPENVSYPIQITSPTAQKTVRILDYKSNCSG